MIMKNTRLIIALVALLGLASCDSFKSKPNEVVPNNDTIVVVEETTGPQLPFEYSFDWMWKVFTALPYLGYDMDVEDTLVSVRERTKQAFELQESKQWLYVHTMDLCYCNLDHYIACFKYEDEDMLLVIDYQPIDCGGGSIEDEFQYYLYDLVEGTLTETTVPIMPLKAEDFFDGLTLLDWSIADYVDDGSGLFYFIPPQNADLTVAYYGLPRPYEERETLMAFDWNGHEFVRKPEADVLGTTIFEEGFCSIPFGSTIPLEVEGFEVTSTEEVTDEVWRKTYYYHKDGELVMVINPGMDVSSGFSLDFDPGNLFLKSNFLVDTITVYSDRYQTVHGLRVGNTVQEVMDKVGAEVGYLYTEDDHLEKEVAGCTYIFDGEEPDARVKKIRLIQW